MKKTQLSVNTEKLTRELERITNVLKQKYQPDKIIVFGSVVKGTTRQWSDLDIVVIKDTKERFYDRVGTLLTLTNPAEAVDFLVYTPQEFADMQTYSFFIRDEVVKKGKILYDKNQ